MTEILIPERRSIDSGISIDSIIGILKAEHDGYKTMPDVQFNLEEQPTVEPSYALDTWNPQTSTFVAESVEWRTRFRRHKRKCSIPCSHSRLVIYLAVLLLLSTAIAIAIAVHLTTSPTMFNGSTGPRGQKPGPLPGKPLSVMGVLNQTLPVYFGASIDWKRDDPMHFNQDIGHPAAIHEAFFYIKDTLVLTAHVNSSGVMHQVPDIISWTAALIRGTGAIMAATFIPLVPLSSINTKTLALIATKCQEINSLGVPILLRFAPDMNGAWYPYSQDPIAYRQLYTSLGKLIHNTTKQTAMVWSPTIGIDYPFASNFSLFLDTNADGVLDSRDDPFTAYYPGDEYVDWIGLSAYDSLSFPFPSSFPSNASKQVNYTITRLSSPSQTFDHLKFYQTFSEAKSKPFIFFTAGNMTDWYTKVYNATLFTNYPLLKAIVWFNYDTDLSAMEPMRGSYALNYNASLCRNVSLLLSNLSMDSRNETGLVFATESTQSHVLNMTAIGS